MYLCGLYIPSLRVRNEAACIEKTDLTTKTQKYC